MWLDQQKCFAKAWDWYSQGKDHSHDDGSSLWFFFSCTRSHKGDQKQGVSLGAPFWPHYQRIWEIKLGNACFRSCFRLIKLLDRYHIPWILENPNTSKAWYLPYFDHLSKQQHIHVVTCDFCQYNKPWRKRTRFFTGNICYDDLHRIQLLCTGKHGICSRTRRPHFHLTGCNSHGQNWTAVAQPYPSKLCEGLAYALTAHKHYNTVLYW